MNLVLASKSGSRRAMLQAAGLQFRCEPANVDERAIEAALAGRPASEIALELAKAKALAAQGHGKLVLGSDSLVTVEGQRFDKPTTRDDAAEHLRFFSGKVMDLHSAAALVRGSEIIWSAADIAHLHVRHLSEDFIADYLDAEWPEVGHCVGVFRIEGRGVNLFDRIEGDYFTILGMPLLNVLAALRDAGEVPA